MGRFSVTYILLVPRAVRKHRLVKVLGPGVTIIVLFSWCLHKGGGVWHKASVSEGGGTSRSLLLQC